MGRGPDGLTLPFVRSAENLHMHRLLSTDQTTIKLCGALAPLRTGMMVVGCISGNFQFKFSLCGGHFAMAATIMASQNGSHPQNGESV